VTFGDVDSEDGETQSMVPNNVVSLVGILYEEVVKREIRRADCIQGCNELSFAIIWR